jgi:hypothetical protein
MTPLGIAVYEILRKRVKCSEPRITYAALARQLRDQSDALDYVHHRSRELYAALVEVGRECRRLRLPPLPALVVRADTGRPGEAYYSGKCSGVARRGDAVAAWRADLEAVKQCRYPR